MQAEDCIILFLDCYTKEISWAQCLAPGGWIPMCHWKPIYPWNSRTYHLQELSFAFVNSQSRNHSRTIQKMEQLRDFDSKNLTWGPWKWQAQHLMLTTNFGGWHAANPQTELKTLEAGSSMLQKLYFCEGYLAPGVHTCIIKEPALGVWCLQTVSKSGQWTLGFPSSVSPVVHHSFPVDNQGMPTDVRGNSPTPVAG